MKLDMIGIVVEDLDTALSFYECLGFEHVGDRYPGYLELDNEGVRISLNTKSMITSVYGFEPSLLGERIELAFKCETPEELDTVVSNIKNKGYGIHREPWNAPWGQYYAILMDADHNLISLFTDELKQL